MITLQQIRAGRAMVGLSQQELAKRAKVSMGTLNNIERGVQTNPQIGTLRAIQEALEAEGIEFIGEDTGNRGVQLSSPSTAKANGTILIIDDSDIDRALYKVWLTHNPNGNYKIIEARDAKEGYDSFLKNKPDCILLDFMMYGKNGFQLLIELKKDHPKVPPIIFVTSNPDPAVKRDVLAMGAQAYLDKKHLSKEKLLEAVTKVLA